MMGKPVVILDRSAILEMDDIGKSLVDVPEWGGAVYVRALTGSERDAFETSLIEEKTVRKGRKQETTRSTNLRNMRAKLCALTICDEDGKRLFSNADVKELGAKSAAALDRVFEVAQRLSGLSDDDVDELVGNSEDDQGEGLDA